MTGLFFLVLFLFVSSDTVVIFFRAGSCYERIRRQNTYQVITFTFTLLLPSRVSILYITCYYYFVDRNQVMRESIEKQKTALIYRSLIEIYQL